MRTLLTAITLLFVSFTLNATINMSDPNQVMHTVSINTFARIKADQTRLQSEPDYIKVVMEEELIPYLDYKYAAYMVMGRYLGETSAAQRNEFVEAFKAYLINAYGHILLEYKQQEIDILDNKDFQDKKIISISVNIHDHNNKLTQLVFKLRKNSKTEEWKVFDVIAEGISMLSTKQSELNEMIHKKGIDHVIKLLEQKNSEFSS
ncbi:MlaC/ttg2D family ABC transporter substrate-binding protein [Psychromonas antarctica]|jgi:phospholipid transport system substrate-binding protein|uniref:MlaC/ttg2D family ABC transporter substrate-binding protein n=1 Tax=Psychromonas antarctica TaxID=67573 RepID=UPI001EE78F8B|nr:ABC transporter substrate-binding protein [Psychromonas antarctica]MCG6199733.1 ABC transporter substrate-binding protein [Psychromonas antarctica]